MTIIVQVPVEIGCDSTIKELRALRGRWMGAQPENVRTPSIPLLSRLIRGSALDIGNIQQSVLQEPRR